MECFSSKPQARLLTPRARAARTLLGFDVIAPGEGALFMADQELLQHDACEKFTKVVAGGQP
jgi:hypothetical protein